MIRRTWPQLVFPPAPIFELEDSEPLAYVAAARLLLRPAAAPPRRRLFRQILRCRAAHTVQPIDGSRSVVSRIKKAMVAGPGSGLDSTCSINVLMLKVLELSGSMNKLYVQHVEVQLRGFAEGPESKSTFP